jgi:hypothetical protein
MAGDAMPSPATPRVRARARQPDRRAHRLQRRARAAVRDRRRRARRARPRPGRPDDPRARARPRRASDSYALGGEAPSPGGWRAFVRGATAELAAAGLPLRGASARDRGHDRARRGAVLLGGARGRALPRAPGARRRRRRAAVAARADLLARRERVGRRADRAARPAGVAVRARERGDADRLPLRRDRAGAARAGDWRLVTLDSGSRHSHAESGYNDRRRECGEACEALGISSLRELEPAMLERAAGAA